MCYTLHTFSYIQVMQIEQLLCLFPTLNFLEKHMGYEQLAVFHVSTYILR